MSSDPKHIEQDFNALLARVRAAAVAAEHDPKEIARREVEARKAEARRIDELHVLADACGAPSQRDVRAAAFQKHPVGPFIDAVREAFTFARTTSLRVRREGRIPALRVLLSVPGVGKSVALTFATVNAPRGAVYTNASELARTHRAMHDNRGAWARWLNTDLLCIDELGVEEKPEVIAELWLDRWSAGGITLCAGNLTRADFNARYLGGALGDRLEDRLREQAARGLLALVESKGTSRRAKKGGAK